MNRFKFCTLNSAIVAAFAAVVFPIGAHAGHFCLVHPSVYIPSVEAMLFLVPPAPTSDKALTPSSEDYMIDQLND